MKKHIFILYTLVLFAFCSCSKDPGETITKTISIDGSYNKLQVENAFDVTVSDTASLLYITTGENVMSKVVVELDDNELKIYLKPFTGYFDTDMKVVIPYNADLTHIELSGASEFHSEFGLKGKKIEVELSGA